MSDNEEILKNISHGKMVQICNQNLTKPLNQSDNKIFLATRNDTVISLGEFDGKFFKPKKVLI